MYQHIVVALDGTPLAEAVLPHVEALARQFGSRVTLVRATTSPEQLIAQTAPSGTGIGDVGPLTDPTPILDAERQEVTDYLEDLARRLKAVGLNAGVEHPEGPAADAVIELAQAIGADLIAMATHGRGGLERLLFGSVADSVVRHAHCPLLLVPVHEPPG